MPPPNFVSGAAFVNLYFSLNAITAINVLGARVSGAPVFGQGLADTLDAGIKAAFAANLAIHMPASTILQTVGVRDYRTPNRPEFRGQTPLSPGVAVGDRLPGQNAMCVTCRTDGAGKSFRGRVYLSGWAEAVNEAAGTQLQAAADAAVNFINDVASVMASAGLAFAVVSRPALAQVTTRVTTELDGTEISEVLSNTAGRAGGVSDITEVQVRNLSWESQRRRNALGGGGGQLALRAVASRRL